jgi:predicted signal transduction protein with EAL and GGDEF domain
MQGYLIGTPMPASAFEAKCLRAPPRRIDADTDTDTGSDFGSTAPRALGMY